MTNEELDAAYLALLPLLSSPETVNTARCRRLAKDWETTLASAEAWILIAHIRLVTRRLARA